MAKRKPPKHVSRSQLLAILQQLRANLDYRRDLLARVPRRGYTRVSGPGKMPLEYKIPTSGAVEILRLITEGQIEVVSRTLVDQLIAELSTETQPDAPAKDSPLPKPRHGRHGKKETR